MNSRAPWIAGLAVAAVAATAIALSACSSATSTLSAPVTPVVHGTLITGTSTPSLGTLGTGFYDPASPPAPEGTITPAPDSWSGAHPPAGYTVVLLTYGDDKPTQTLVRAVRSWAKHEGVALTTLVAPSVSGLLDTANRAIALEPDLIVSAGNDYVDALAAVTPSFLSQQFLVVGAEVAEPTSNVTAADWTGAGFRGEGLGTPSHYDEKTFTTARADRAIRAGVAAVVNNVTGIVVWVS